MTLHDKTSSPGTGWAWSAGGRSVCRGRARCASRACRRGSAAGTARGVLLITAQSAVSTAPLTWSCGCPRAGSRAPRARGAAPPRSRRSRWAAGPTRPRGSCSPRRPPGTRSWSAATAGVTTSAANRLIGEVVQSRRRPLLGPSPG